MKVKSVIVNWFYGTEGDEFCSYTVGSQGVISIDYHEPKGEGDRHYCDIVFEDKTIREFNINNIEFVN